MRWVSRVSSWNRKLSDGAVFGCLLAIAVLSTRYSVPLIDDVHITLRHAVNFANGDGLVYNPGERLLGASSPIYALLLGALVPIFSNPIAPAIYLWPLALAVAGFLVYQLAGRGPLGIGAAVVVCTDPSLVPVVGMETTVYVATLFTILALFDRERLGLVAFLLGLLPMIRPDGVFMIAALTLVWLVENRASLGRAFVVRHARLIGLFLLPLVVWCVFATAYYGQPLPNSFIAKYHQSKVTWWWTDGFTFRTMFGERLGEPRYRWLAIAGSAGALLAVFRKDRVLRASALYTVLYLTAFVVSRVPGYRN
jgi:arabinofuranosyltransferase